MIEHKILPFGSEKQLKTIELRDLVLRKPLGMQFTAEQLAAEHNQLHIGQFENGELTACLVMKPISSKVAKMRQVAVDPKQQGKGYGSLLVQFTEKEMQIKGYEQIELHARDVAISFYKRMNYQVIGDCFEEVGIPHNKMVKKLI